MIHVSPHAHWTAPTAAPIRPIAAPGHDTRSRDSMYIVRYGIVPALRFDSQKFTLKSCTAHCAVQCTLKVVVTREESLSALAEWVMFDAVKSDTCDLLSASLFRLQHLM